MEKRKVINQDFQAIPQAPEFQSKHNKTEDFPKEKLARITKEKLADEVAIDEDRVELAQASTNQEQSIKEVVDNNIEQNYSSDYTATKVTPVKKQTVPAKANTLRPIPEKSVMGEAWVIHLGSFRYKKNVEQLLKKLTDNGLYRFYSIN